MTIPVAEYPAWLQDIARDLPALMTVEEATAALRMSKRQLLQLIKDRQLLAVRKLPAGSSRVFIPRGAVLDWLAAHELT